MRIPCPLCGERGSEEFLYLGAASVTRPDTNAEPEAWYRYVYLRDNPAGANREFWHHQHGCRSWLVVERDTRSHTILGASLARKTA
jgi:methylglutamate dehydrogenase subunit B